IIIVVWLLGMWYAIANYELMILTSEIAMHEIVERVMDLLISINPRGEITGANQRTLDLLGCSRAKLIGSSLENIIIEPEAIDQLLSAMRGNLTSVENVSMTYRTCKDEMIPVNVSGSAVKSRLGTMKGLVIVAQDMRQARQLEQATAATRDLLNNAGQGFLSFSSSLLVRQGYSSECISIFQTEIENRSIVQLLYPSDPEQHGFIEELLNRILAEKDEDRLDLYMPLLPIEVLLNQRNIALEYRIIDHQNQDPDRLFMLILTDITEKRDLENQMEEEKRILRMVVRVVVNQRDFMDCVAEYRKFFIDEMKQLFERRPFAETIGLILRAVHTFKGNFSQFNMDNLVAKLHELESYLSTNDNRTDNWSDWDKVKSHLLSLDIHLWLEEEMEVLADVLGEQFFNQESTILVDKARLLRIERKALSNLSVADCNLMLPELRRLRYIPFKELIAAYPEYVEQMAERMDKLINPLQIVGSDVAVDPDHYQELARALVHVFRNSVAHGIESPQDRIEAGKEDFGNIWCEILAVEDRLLLNIGDDGQGIDLAKLAAKAVEFGLYTRETVVDASEADLLALLFNDQFSLTEQVTDYSGRGVGLAAVKEALDAIGGGVEIHTELGIGTMFKFSLPLEINYNYEKASTQDVIIPLLDTACSFIAGQLGEEKPFEPIILKPERLTLSAFASFIDIKGVIKGKFILSIGEEIGRKLIEAFKIAHLNDAEVDDLIEDALAETANIIIGNSIAKFPGIENSVVISTPITIYSREAVVAFSESQIWSSTLTFQQGEVLFAVVVNHLP
ncbi:MAG: PAS domain S-box protein, partial [Ignavibacteriales bacterium]